LVIASLALLYQQLGGSPDGEPVVVAETDGSLDQDSPFSLVESQPVQESTGVAAAGSFLEISEVAEDESDVVESLIGNISIVLPGTEVDTEIGSLIEADNADSITISDSNLSLVTAQQRGVTVEEIADPVFEEIVLSSAAVLSPATTVSDQTSLVIENQPEDAVSQAEPKPEVIEIAEQSISTIAVEEVVEPIEQQVITDITEPVDSQVDEALPDIGLAQNSDNTEAVSNELSLPEQESAQESVEVWLSAWENQSLEEYFASYHSEYVPRYHDTETEWRRDRERVIGNANQISLELSDFTIVSEDQDSMEVQFWLAYQSPTYRDDTRKKLVLKQAELANNTENRTTNRWLILEEVNLIVRN